MKNKKEVILNVEQKKGKHYFFIPNTRGVPSAAVQYTYDLILNYRNAGHDAFAIHEDDFVKPHWVDTVYRKIPHNAIKTISITNEDFLYLPEVFISPFFESIEKDINVEKGKKMLLPCEVIVIAQNHNNIFKTLKIGESWSKFGVKRVITTSEIMKEYVLDYFPHLSVDIIPLYISDVFKPSEKPVTPSINIFCKNTNDVESIVNKLTTLAPHLSFLPIKSVNKLNRVNFAEQLKDCALAVWLDNYSSFGTFPLEAMKCRVPVIGKVPDMTPDWMLTKTEESVTFSDNGVWLTKENSIPKAIADFMNKWLMDGLPQLNKVLDLGEETAKSFTKEKQNEATQKFIKDLIKYRLERLKSILKDDKEKTK